MDLKQTQGEPRLLISRQAILHNVGLIRNQLQPGTKICAMVKADAYGHSARIVVDTLCNFAYDGLPTPAVDQLGVACLEEAAALDDRSSLPILVLRAIENVYVGRAREAIEYAVQRSWVLTIGTAAAADDLARIALPLGKRAMVHVMIDTGMTRCGCPAAAVAELVARITSHGSLKLVSIGSHFATADVKDHRFMSEQFLRFQSAMETLNGRSGAPVRTLANSGGIFYAPDAHLEMVRPGIALYGIDPTCKPSVDRALRPVAKWTAPVISILDVRRETSVGYGQTWRAPHDTRIGLVPIGYADGYLRAWGNRATMVLHGKWVPVVGRVSMDLVTIDLHGVPQARIGDDVTVMDNDPLSPASAYALADLAETIPYEVFTRIGQRVKRVAVEQNMMT